MMIRKQVLLRICSLVLTVSIVLPIGAQAADLKSLDAQSVGMEAIEAQRFLDVASTEAKAASTAFQSDVSVSSTKPLVDFAGNAYTLIELKPTGYMIYHNASGQFVEESTSSPSPYARFNTNLYYGGPTQYYVLDHGTYRHTVIDERHTQADVDAYASVCKQAHNNYIKETNTEVVNYIKTGNKSQLASIADTINRSESAPTYIRHAFVLSNCQTKSEMSYFGMNACGYIAAALLMLWYREAINSTYVTSVNGTGPSYLSIKNGYHVFNGDPANFANGRTFSYNLWRWHSDSGQADYMHGYYGTGAGDIADTLESYVKGKGLPYSYDIDIFPTTSSIISKIDSRNRPYLLWGTGVQPADGSQNKCNHAVIVYGHWNGYLLCNFGWEKYHCSSVKGFWASGLMLRQ